MGLRSSDESGADSPQETWDRMQEVKNLREAVRYMMGFIESGRPMPPSQVLALRAKPEIQRALDNIFEGIVK